jgi:hypothetical protein
MPHTCYFFVKSLGVVNVILLRRADTDGLRRFYPFPWHSLSLELVVIEV